ncbi:MAG: amidohydrolase family protein [Niastella sp.]|nr:amidohydrolase family protein [Niastella sp.]
MKKIFLVYISLVLFTGMAQAQDDVYPAPAQTRDILIKNGTIHVGNGQVLKNTSILVQQGKITAIGNDLKNENAVVIDASGKQVYPGLIAASTIIGLREVTGSVRGTNDYRELGELNPNVRSVVSYNADSKIINILRSNGILLANIIPQGSLLMGTSSVVQFDAWNWEDAAYKLDGGIHINFPGLLIRRSRFRQNESIADQQKEAMEKVEMLRSFFKEAKAYLAEKNHAVTNLKFEAVKGLYDKSQKLYIHCDIVKEMLVAIDFAKAFGFDVVIVGGSESWRIADLLNQNGIAVILQQLHDLPTLDDDDVDQPFKTPFLLKKAGVLFCINDNDGNTTGRNLAFNAGTSAAYGLNKEEALQAITLDAAKILGISDKTGSLETGKDANIIISTGDVLDMETSVITNALIQGREINLMDKHKQLNERYERKYGIK